MATDLPPFTENLPIIQTQPPNPQWNIGQGVEHSKLGKEWAEAETQGWKVVDTEKVADVRYLYSLMVSGIIPRPVAFVSTIAADGTENLAPFSWFNMLTAQPPTVSISMTRSSPSRGNDSAENINATKTFTVNIISEPWVEQANFCSVNSPPNVSEWPGSGLTKAPSTQVKPARVKESAFSMECEILQTHDLFPVGSSVPSTTLVIGLVKVIHVRKDVLNERETVDPAKFRAISRLGGLSYGRISESFELLRPRWDEVGEEVASLG